MSRSSIERLDPRIKEAVDRLIRDGSATIDEIVERIDELGGEASRSAVGRYAKSVREQLEQFRQAQEMAKVWAGELGEEPSSKLGRMVTQLLRAAAQRHAIMTQGGGDPRDVATLSRAIKDLASADKLMADRELRIRRELAAEAADAAAEVAHDEGLSEGTVSAIKARILGVA